MATAIEYIVYATGNPIESIGITPRAITGEVVTGLGRKISVDHALMIAKD